MNFEPDSFLSSIHHDGSARYVLLEHGEDQNIGDIVTVRLRAAPHAPIERLLLRFAPDGEQQFIEMQPQMQRIEHAENPACNWWQASLQIHMPVTRYRFLIFVSSENNREDGAWWYNAAGLQRSTPTDGQDFCLLANYAAPTWVRDSVFYQIFPDRFADGDPENNVRQGEFEYRGAKSFSRPWGEPPTPHFPDSMVEFFGGDLAGVSQKLDYLLDLGVNALYLNPIFTARSNHRYNVTDYEQVDPHLGGNSALVALRNLTQANGIRLMLDIVPNHCGYHHSWFQEALKDIHAPSAQFFTFYHHPDDYACWLGVRSLPKLNYRSQALRDIMYSGQASIFRRWLRPPYSIDGWRLDVANMLARQGVDQLGVEIGRGIRQAVKEENPQAYLLGENFFDGTPQLQGDLWDATMNYAGFSMPLWYWLGRFAIFQHAEPHHIAAQTPYPTRALAESWQNFRAAIPWTVARQQFNLLGSHDTARILSGVQGNPALNRLAAGILMTYPGVPSIFYGDEVGLTGEGDQTRSCMPWDPAQWDHDLRRFYQTLIRLRRTSSALIHGGFQVLLIEENTIAYLRDSNDEQIVVIAHRGPAERPNGSIPVAHGAIPDGAQFTELFSRQQATVSNGKLAVGALPAGITIWISQG